MTVTTSEKFTLYHANMSLCSQMVRVALFERGIEYEPVHVKLCDQYDEAENLQPWFLELNPTGVVPVLKVDDQVFYDSAKIIEGLDQYGAADATRLWPEDPEKRDELRRWVYSTGLPDDAAMGQTLGTAAAIFSSVLLAHYIKKLKFRSIINILRKHPRRDRAWIFTMMYFTPLAKRFPQTAFDGFVRELLDIEKLLSDGREYLLEEYSHADINIMCVFHRINEVRLGKMLEMQELPHIARYWERLKQRPGYKAGVLDYLGPRERDLSYQVFKDADSPHLEKLQRKVREAVA
ncbi:MAG: glutathione S-transferase family protein [Pseudomonadota bacterium]